jgi:hypothetical protein
MLRAAIIVLLLFATGCSQPQPVASQQDTERVRLASDQDARCRETVINGLSPSSFDYGVVSNAGTAKGAASAYFRAMFADTGVPVEQVLQRPLTAELRNGVWHVANTLPKDALGVQLFAQICQSNGRVLVLTGEQ